MPIALLPTAVLAAVRLEYLQPLEALGLFALLAIPILLLGWNSLKVLGPVRRWVALAARLLVILLAVLILAGLRMERDNKIVEVIVLRDLSESAQQAAAAGSTISQRVSEYLQSALALEGERKADDRVGVISFDGDAYVDLIPTANNTALAGQTTAVNRQTPGTDPASAIQLALATFNEDARKRILLIWDGNLTEGDLAAAVALAKAQNVPIDVMPLKYQVSNEVYVERFVAPTWRREKEPFTLDVILTNTSAFPTPGTLRIEQEGAPLDLDPAQPGLQSGRAVVLQPGRNRESILVDPMEGVDVRRFKAVFEPERRAGPGGVQTAVGDTLASNNTASAFTFVRGKGKVLYIDNTGEQGGSGGEMLRSALAREGITIDANRIFVDSFPTSMIDLQAFDAVILANVPRGAGGLTDPQQRMLAQYVHDTGGGLVMIGGPDAFGAGGWQESELEEVLPVDMDVPAKRQIPKGALVLIMHSSEIPQANYWSEQCALKAVEVLNRRDDIGVLSYGMMAGGAAWDFPLQEKGDGSRVYSAIKNMNLGDMPDFDDAMDLALNGDANSIGLKESEARQKHVIIISDMDPAPPSPQLLQAYIDAQISVSTVQCGGHGQPLMPVAIQLAEATGGRAYGPVENNPSQLPQIFIKEATIVRRSLIKEDSKGLPVSRTLDAAGSQLMQGIPEVPPVFGYVLTSKKDNPLVEVPLVLGDERDPLFAIWQTGLGKSAAWTSDAHNRWAANFTGGEAYDKFWAQLVRGVSRAAQSGDYEVRTVVEDGRGKIIVEALGDDAQFRSNLAIRGLVLGPRSATGAEAEQIQLVQTSPGTYEAEFDAREEGPYVVSLQALDPEGGQTALRGGTSVNGSEEMMALKDDEAAARRVAEETGGRVIPMWATGGHDLYAVDYVDAMGIQRSLPRSTSPLPIWDWLIPVLLALILVDVAIRRIAWDWGATKAVVARAGERVRMITATTREEIEGRPAADTVTLGALRQAREQAAAGARQPSASATAVEERPDPSRKFEASGEAPEGDLSQVVGGATDKPVPKGPAGKVTPKGQRPDKPGSGDGMSSLMEAKRRARENIERQRKE